MTETPIAKAIRLAGGPTSVARLLGVSQPFASQMSRGVRPLPSTRVLALEAACAGAVTRHELRPDVFGPPPAKGAK